MSTTRLVSQLQEFLAAYDDAERTEKAMESMKVQLQSAMQRLQEAREALQENKPEKGIRHLAYDRSLISIHDRGYVEVNPLEFPNEAQS